MEPDNSVYLDTPADTEASEPLYLATPQEVATPQPSADTASVRSKKVMYALADSLKKTEAQVYQGLMQGQEDSLRTQAVADQSIKQAEQRSMQVQDLARRQGPLLSSDIQKIYQPFDQNPNTVFEKNYADKWVSTIDDVVKIANSDVFKNEDPAKVEALKGATRNFVTKIEVVNNLIQNATDEIANQSTIGWVADQAKSLVTQIYPEAKLRGLVPTSENNLFFGNALQAQADKLWDLPDDEFQKQLTTIYNGIKQDNPSLAKSFLEYVKGASDSQRAIDNVSSVFIPLDLAAVGKGLTSIARGASRAVRAEKVAKDMMEAAKNADPSIPTKAAAAEGAGDTVGAGAIRASDNLNKEINGTLDPNINVQEKLTTNFDLMAANLVKNPGKMSREVLTRLQDNIIKSGQSLKDTLLNTMRVNRTPNPLQSEEAVRAYNETLRNKYRGVDNQIADISNPIHEPITNTYHSEVRFMSNDGALFSTPEVARENAKLNGFSDVRIMEGTGAVEKTPAQLEGSAYNLKRKGQLEGDTGSIARYKQAITDVNKQLKDTSLTKEAKKELRSRLKDFKDTLARFTKELDTINSKVKMGQAVIEQNGIGYSYSIKTPFKETNTVVQNYLIKNGQGQLLKDAKSTGSNTGIEAWRNSLTRWFRGADDTLAMQDSVQRKISTYARNNLQAWAEKEAKNIEDLTNGTVRINPWTGEQLPWYRRTPRSFINGFRIKNKQAFEEFNATLDYARKAIDPDTKEVGYFFQTPGELENFYQTNFQRLPTIPEVQAYFSHVKLTEFDRVLREISEFTRRAREGTEQHQIFIKGKDGKKIASGFFEGIQLDHFPRGTGQVLFMGENEGSEKLAYLSRSSGTFSKDQIQNYKEMIQQGRYKVIQLYNPSEFPLRNFSKLAGDAYVKFVITPVVETKPIDFAHVNRRGGGHFEYDYEHYIKQARMIPQISGQSNEDLRKVVANLYAGDITAMPISSRAMGLELAGKMNAVRELIAADKLEEAKELAGKTLPMNWDEFYSKFKPRMINGKEEPPSLNVNEPFQVVPRGKRIYDMDTTLEKRYAGFEDESRSGSPAARNQVSYNQERDAEKLMTVNRTYDNGNPVFTYEPATLVNPIPTMNRALNRAINSVFMDDYKFYAVNAWLREAEPHLTLADSSEISSSPFYWFENIKDKSAFKSATPPEVINNLLSNQQKIKQFLGMPNSFDASVHSLTQHLIDAGYRGGESAEKFMAIPIWALSKAKDPVQLVRSFAYNAKLGLFNPAQLFVQAQTFANIWAIEGRTGAAGTYATLLHQIARTNSSPNVLKYLDEMATKFNMFGVKWKPGEFLEARDALKRTGFEAVAGEHQYADTQLQHTFMKNQFGNFLNAGQVFFREGEKSTRLGAFYTSYKKWRDLNPVGKVTDKDLSQILNWADTLTNNMSRASVSNMHTEVFSLTSQFLSYQMHLMDLFFGKRLGETVAQRNYARARMFLTYAGLYGVPASSGLIGYPFGDSIRQEAIDRGYVVGESWYKSLIMEGIPSYATFLATGNAYNIGSRYGSQGLQFIQDSMQSDYTVWKIIGGAGLSVMSGFFSGLSPLQQSISTWMNGKNEDMAALGKDHPFTVDDFIEPFKEISSVNALWKTIHALNTGRWLTKNEGFVKDTNKLDAMFMGITGLSPQGQDDMYNKTQIQNAEKEYFKHAEKEAIKQYQRGIQASLDGNQEQANEYFRKAYARLHGAGYPLDMMAQFTARANRGWESQISSISDNFATRHVPESKDTWIGKMFRTMGITPPDVPFISNQNIPNKRLEQLQTQTKIGN